MEPHHARHRKPARIGLPNRIVRRILIPMTILHEHAIMNSGQREELPVLLVDVDAIGHGRGDQLLRRGTSVDLDIVQPDADGIGHAAAGSPREGAQGVRNDHVLHMWNRPSSACRETSRLPRPRYPIVDSCVARRL